MSVIHLSDANQLGRRATVADGEVTVRRGPSTSFRWSEIIVSIYDASGNEVTTVASGTISGKSVKTGTTRSEDFPTTPTINLATDSWSWKPELSTVKEFRFTAASLPTDHTYDITVSSWG